MDKPILKDKEQFPTEEIIFSHIVETKTYWKILFETINSQHPEFTSEWRYYNDGKSWLMKTVRKSKTIFWLAVFQDSFKVTFYFGDKAESTILSSSISKALKDSFQFGKRYGKIRGITIKIENQNDIENVLLLIEIKLSIK